MTEPTEIIESSGMRLSRYLARCGVAARRKAEEYITAGRVTINGTVCTEFHRRVDEENDIVHVDGVRIRTPLSQLTLIHYKPMMVLVSRGDPGNRRTVYDSLPEKYAPRAKELVYIGRLDWDTEGLLLMTTDGELTNRCTHPKYHLEKEYWLASDPQLRPQQLARLMKGIELEDGPARALHATMLPEPVDGLATRIVLGEGRNRQVRRMVETLGPRVTKLRRVRFGPIGTGIMKPGDWREIGRGELINLRQLVGMAAEEEG